GDDAPSYTELQKALTDVGDVAHKLLDKKLAVDPDPPELAAAGGQSAGAGGAGGPQTLAAEPTSVDDAGARIASAARFLRHADPRNPAPYLVLRGFRWGELRARGGDVDPKLLTAPPTQVRTHLKGLLLDGKWPELLDAGEDVMATPLGRGWLDLQRYELTACAQLGTEYDLVVMALRGALVGLLRDVPRLPDLTLMDDTPTANAETRAWLQNGGLLAAAAEAAAEAMARPALTAPETAAVLVRALARAPAASTRCRQSPSRVVKQAEAAMAQLEVERTVQWSVLDRLIDTDPHSPAEPSFTWAQSVRELKRALRRDLEWLLNTRRIVEP